MDEIKNMFIARCGIAARRVFQIGPSTYMIEAENGKTYYMVL